MVALHDSLDYIYKRYKRKYNATEYTPGDDDCDKLKTSEWASLLLLKINIDNFTYKVILAIPSTFPYKYPSVYLHNEHYNLINLPHIDRNKFICTFDSELSIPNIYKPFEMCNDVVNRALKIIREGLCKSNFADYEDEYLAYWTDKGTNQEIISIVSPSKKIKDICIYDIEKINFKNYKYLIADSAKSGMAWLSNSGASKSGIPLSYSYGVYFPINSAKFEIVPNKNKDILSLLQGNKLKELFAHLDSKQRPTLVLCNYKNIMFAWEHQEYTDNIIQGVKTFTRKHQKGFRAGRQSTFLEISGFAKELELKKYNIDRFDKERLFTRGGEGLNVDQKYKINLCGCGSIGSFLFERLVSIGFNNFCLIDNETLQPENLARHFCDISDLDINKAQALKAKIHKRYPLLESSILENDILDILFKNIQVFNSADLNIFCIGNYNIELLATKKIEGGKINKPVLIIWVEPNLSAGHAIYIAPEDPISFEGLHSIINKTLTYKYALIKDEKSKVSKRESGCQSVYIPYGSLDISNFVNCIANMIKEHSFDKPTKSHIYRWTKEDSNIFNSKFEEII